jgi:hypothetical protein
MGCSLRWKPRSKKDYGCGSYQLRDILENKYGYPSNLDYSDLTYLESLQDAGVEGAEDLIEAIRKHDEIEIYKEC